MSAPPPCGASMRPGSHGRPPGGRPHLHHHESEWGRRAQEAMARSQPRTAPSLACNPLPALSPAPSRHARAWRRSALAALRHCAHTPLHREAARAINAATAAAGCGAGIPGRNAGVKGESCAQPSGRCSKGVLEPARAGQWVPGRGVRERRGDAKRDSDLQRRRAGGGAQPCVACVASVVRFPPGRPTIVAGEQGWVG